MNTACSLNANAIPNKHRLALYFLCPNVRMERKQNAPYIASHCAHPAELSATIGDNQTRQYVRTAFSFLNRLQFIPTMTQVVTANTRSKTDDHLIQEIIITNLCGYSIDRYFFIPRLQKRYKIPAYNIFQRKTYYDTTQCTGDK